MTLYVAMARCHNQELGTSTLLLRECRPGSALTRFKPAWKCGLSLGQFNTCGCLWPPGRSGRSCPMARDRPRARELPPSLFLAAPNLFSISISRFITKGHDENTTWPNKLIEAVSPLASCPLSIPCLAWWPGQQDP